MTAGHRGGERPESEEPAGRPTFAEELEASRRTERSMPWRELAALALVAVVAVVRALWLG